MQPSRIEFVIDELVLHGFAPGDRHAIADAVQSHLEGLLAAAPTASAQDCSIDRQAPQPVTLAPGARAGAIGSGIAQAIHGGLPL